MSFFDDASLAFLPSGAAGKDGKAYSIKPVPEYGSELVTNGDFASNINNWAAKDCTIVWDNGKIKCDNSSGNSGGGAYQNVGLQNNKTYRFIATIQIISASGNGAFRVATSAANGTGQSTRYTGSTLVAGGDAVTEIGEFTTGTDGDVSIQFNVDRANAVFTIDNVSVQEVLVGDGDFTFSRGSNLSATRIGPDGLIEKGRENLYTESNNFSDSDWSPKAGTFAKGVTDPNGGTDAWSWTATNTDPFLYQSKNFTGVHCLSIYVKGVGSTIGEDFQIRVGTNIKDITLTGDWQRVQHFGVLSGSVNIGFEYGNPATANDVVHIYAAQLETGLVATEVISTGASTGKAGLLEDEPRFDYSGGATCPSLLLEPSRTNLVGYSEYANGFNIVGTGTATDNATTSPEGLINAFELNDTSSSAYYRIEEFISVSAGDHTMSVFVKKTTGTPTHYPAIQLDSSRDYVILNTKTGAYNESGGTDNDSVEIEDWNADWWRVIITNTLTSGSKRIAIWPAISSNGTGSSPSPTGSNVFYGAQLEAGSYPTSYIPNHSGGSVTRGADVCNSAGDSSTFNDSEGVLYAEISALANDGTNRRIVISDGTFNNNVQLYYYPTSNAVRTLVNSGGITSIDATAALSDATNYHKIAIRYKTNDFSLWVDGVEVGTDTSGNAPSGLNQLNFNDAGGSNFYGKTKQILTFKTALTDSELATLTTL